MADRFFDTSAVVKHYRAELGSAKVDAFLAESGARHFLSAIGVVEPFSVLARLVRTGLVGVPDFHLFRGRFLADVASGQWQVAPVVQAQFHRALQLLVHHGLGRSLRTLDALQLAVALTLHSSVPLAAFVCGDANLCHVAAAEGLVVVNPEVP
jgi:hypothetical protein